MSWTISRLEVYMFITINNTFKYANYYTVQCPQDDDDCFFPQTQLKLFFTDKAEIFYDCTGLFLYSSDNLWNTFTLNLFFSFNSAFEIQYR